jgi:hypothetical protein
MLASLWEKRATAPLVVLLGKKDTDPKDKYLPRDAGARAQGEHRFARGHTSYASPLVAAGVRRCRPENSGGLMGAS